MQETYWGHIVIWPINFAPQNWAYCGGQLVPIADNPSLYALLGTNYGGDGRSLFGIPDLRSRIPVGAEMVVSNYQQPPLAPGLTSRVFASKGGVETITLDITQMPKHSHVASSDFSVTAQPEFVATAEANCVIGTNTQTNNPSMQFWAEAPGSTATQAESYAPGPANSMMNPAAVTVEVSRTVNVEVAGSATVGETGNGESVGIVQPFLALNFCICVEGLFPPRS